MNRRTVIVDANGNRTKTVYDLAGQVKAITNANGEAITNTYDGFRAEQRVHRAPNHHP